MLLEFNIRALPHPSYQKSAIRPSKWPPNDPKFRDFSYFYMTYLKSQKKIFLVFHSDFGCLEGGAWKTPPPPLNIYFLWSKHHLFISSLLVYKIDKILRTLRELECKSSLPGNITRLSLFKNRETKFVIHFLKEVMKWI